VSIAQDKDLVLTDYAKKLIRFKARQLCRRRDFRAEEPEDVQQDLWMAVVRARGQFDPAKASLNTFIDRVVNSAVAMLVRTRERRDQLQGPIGTESLDVATIRNGHQPQLKADSVTASDLSRRVGSQPRDESQQREICEAIACALAAMPKAQRRLCHRLMAGSVNSVSRQLGISRRQIRNRIAENRPYFEQFGLGWA